MSARHRYVDELARSHERVLACLEAGPASMRDLIEARYPNREPPPRAKQCIANIITQIRLRRPEIRIRTVYVVERIQ